jgi:dihydrofolate reductase
VASSHVVSIIPQSYARAAAPSFTAAPTAMIPVGEARLVCMGKLIYSAIASADGYVEDTDGGFDWGAPTEEVHSFVNELERPAATYLYGRRMYEAMLYWETAHTLPGQPPCVREFTGIWQAADKVVFSKTLESVSSARTRIERDFDPGAIRRLKSGSRRDMTVGGADLAGQAIGAGLVDELHLFLVPATVGGGKPVLPEGVRLDLQLLDSRRFADGTVYLRYFPILA